MAMRPITVADRKQMDAQQKPKRLMGKFSDAKMAQKLKKSFKEDQQPALAKQLI